MRKYFMRYNIFRARDRFQENHSTLKLIQTSVFERKKQIFIEFPFRRFFPYICFAKCKHVQEYVHVRILF